jgi:hypothetical protein
MDGVFEKWFETSGFDPEYKVIAESAWNAAINAAKENLDDECHNVLDDLYA